MSYKKNSKQPDILFLISEFNFLKSHRLNLIRFLSKKYKRILILTNIEEVDPAELKRLNLSSRVQFKNFYLDRSAIGIFKNLLFLFNLFKVLAFYKPKRLFLVSSKPILLGGICSLFLPIQKTYFNISGLGYLFISEKFKAKIIKNLVLIIYRIIHIGLISRNSFSKLVCFGFAAAFFIYVAVNMSMVLGLLPIVGAPLPIMSYGGSSMLSMMVGLGIVMSCKIFQSEEIG